MHLFHFLSVFWLNGISLWQCGGMRYGLQQDDLGIIILLIVQNPPSPLLGPHFPLSHRQPAKNQACYYVIHTQWFPHYIATLFKLYYGWMNDCGWSLCWTSLYFWSSRRWGGDCHLMFTWCWSPRAPCESRPPRRSSPSSEGPSQRTWGQFGLSWISKIPVRKLAL